jgi:hypothetical protein
MYIKTDHMDQKIMTDNSSMNTIPPAYLDIKDKDNAVCIYVSVDWLSLVIGFSALWDNMYDACVVTAIGMKMLLRNIGIQETISMAMWVCWFTLSCNSWRVIL